MLPLYSGNCELIPESYTYFFLQSKNNNFFLSFSDIKNNTDVTTSRLYHRGFGNADKGMSTVLYIGSGKKISAPMPSNSHSTHSNTLYYFILVFINKKFCNFNTGYIFQVAEDIIIYYIFLFELVL